MRPHARYMEPIYGPCRIMNNRAASLLVSHIPGDRPDRRPIAKLRLPETKKIDVRRFLSVLACQCNKFLFDHSTLGGIAAEFDSPVSL